MPLMTRCTHCQTVFRIMPEQLQAHGGQVRCGRCMQVFNGLAALVPDVPTAAVPDTVPAVPATAAPVAEPVEPAPVPQSPPVPAAAVEPDPETAAAEVEPSAAADPGALIEILPEAPPPASTEKHQPEPVARQGQPAPAVADTDNPFFHEPEMAEEPAPRRPWLAAASVLLAAALTAQAVYFYRGEIAARHPLARQWLTEFCARAGCTVMLPQLPKAVLIEASDLQALDPAQPGRIQLTATLRNHAGHDVAYPALDLVLTNANDHTLARRIFLPADYLGSGGNPRAGIAANAELTVRLALDIGNLGAAGFRLAVLAAPRN